MVAPPLSTILLISFLLLFVVLRPSFCRAAAASSPSSTPPTNNNKNNDDSDGRRFCSDPYDVLRVDRHCDQGEIRRQHRRLCLRHHPDKKKRGTATRERCGHPDDGDFEFKEVQHAYSLVGTEEERRKYDLLSSSERANFAGRGDGRRYARRRDDAANVFVPSTVYFSFGDGGGLAFRFSSDIRHDLFRARGRAYRDLFGASAFAASPSLASPRPHYLREAHLPSRRPVRRGGEKWS